MAARSGSPTGALFAALRLCQQQVRAGNASGGEVEDAYAWPDRAEPVFAREGLTYLLFGNITDMGEQAIWIEMRNVKALLRSWLTRRPCNPWGSAGEPFVSTCDGG